MKSLQKIGLGIFLLAFVTFASLPILTTYEVTESLLMDFRTDPAFQKDNSEEVSNPAAWVAKELEGLPEQAYSGKVDFFKAVRGAVASANESIAAHYNALLEQAGYATWPDSAFVMAEQTESGKFKYNKAVEASLLQGTPKEVSEAVQKATDRIAKKEYATEDAFTKGVSKAYSKATNKVIRKQQISNEDTYVEYLAKSTGKGPFTDNSMLGFLLIIVGGAIGGLLYTYPAFFDGLPGIKHNGIYFSSATNRGLIGILMCTFLVVFYVLLYFYPLYIIEWISLSDPVSMALRGEPASQWFMYGFLYTVVILVMGVRMFTKYRHSNYHKIRTASVMFFQLAFAFIIPQILYQLNLPDSDLKNAWPLNYYFFFDWNIKKHIAAGTFGQFMLVWGILLSVVGVPLLTYFFGKRWYCSWVCGCGGLAETLGDPYRQLSDKTTEAWQIERVLIHSVLVFAVVMTGIVLYTYLGETSFKFSMNRAVLMGLFVAVGAGLLLFHWRKYPHMGRKKIASVIGVIVGAVGIGLWYGFTEAGAKGSFVTSEATISSYDIRNIYGFSIGSVFAGVVGTGLYPILGNRPWCRFGCPLAAYLGLVQRFKSRFRITTNGGQCISCGNCSTYCEMGIDVRAYAQRGQNIVRSSCVGCGVCAAVCPRGVLALENGPNSNASRMSGVEEEENFGVNLREVSFATVKSPVNANEKRNA